MLENLVFLCVCINAYGMGFYWGKEVNTESERKGLAICRGIFTLSFFITAMSYTILYLGKAA
jgi:hypothetical protein